MDRETNECVQRFLSPALGTEWVSVCSSNVGSCSASLEKEVRMIESTVWSDERRNEAEQAIGQEVQIFTEESSLVYTGEDEKTVCQGTREMKGEEKGVSGGGGGRLFG